MGIRRFFWSEWGDSVHYGVDPVEPGSSNCPPDSCIEIGSRPATAQKLPTPLGSGVFGIYYTF